jgi:hypothetical protein
MTRQWGLVALWGCLACGADAVTGGSAGDETASTGAEASGTGPAVIPPCDDAVPLLQPGAAQQDSGLFRCANGFIHRVFTIACDPSAWTAGDCSVDDPAAECSVDADCVGVGGLQGLCIATPGPVPSCRCNYGCSQDADCGAGLACYCDGIRSSCIPATCRTDSDCPTDQPCGLNQRVGACGEVSRSLSCATPQDECRIDSQCLDCQQCLRVDDADRWYCTGNTGICGPCG